jgi:hypothetical protein
MNCRNPPPLPELSQTPEAIGMRKTRARERFLFRVAEVFVDARRLSEVNDHNIEAIEKANRAARGAAEGRVKIWSRARGCNQRGTPRGVRCGPVTEQAKVRIF